MTGKLRELGDLGKEVGELVEGGEGLVAHVVKLLQGLLRLRFNSKLSVSEKICKIRSSKSNPILSPSANISYFLIGHELNLPFRLSRDMPLPPSHGPEDLVTWF